MRCIVKVQIPMESGNAMIVENKLKDVVGGILEELKPEAAYFYSENGTRAALFILDLADASKIPSIAEPFFLALNARVEILPAMTAEDLMKAGPDLEAAVKKWAPHRAPALTR